MDFIADWNANAALLHETYRPEDEHANCGVGLVAVAGRAAPGATWCRPASTR